MTDLQLYRANPHFAPDSPTDFSEDCDRLDKCQDEAIWFFNRVTKEALQEFTNKVVDLQPYYGSPRWERERDAAKARYSAATADARALYQISIDELFKTGEISEETADKWELLSVAQAMGERLQAAE
jgi:hypothetical protein